MFERFRNSQPDATPAQELTSAETSSPDDYIDKVVRVRGSTTRLGIAASGMILSSRTEEVDKDVTLRVRREDSAEDIA